MLHKHKQEHKNTDWYLETATKAWHLNQGNKQQKPTTGSRYLIWLTTRFLIAWQQLQGVTKAYYSQST